MERWHWLFLNVNAVVPKEAEEEEAAEEADPEMSSSLDLARCLH